MSGSSFNSQKPRLVSPRETPIRYLVWRPREMEPWIKGLYFKVVSESYQEWAILSPAKCADSTDLIKMLALAVIDRSANIVNPSFMPSRPASAVLRDDGTFRHSVTRPFSPWIESRITNVVQRMKGFSEELFNELWNDYRDSASVLTPCPPDAPFQESAAQQFEIEIPHLPNQLDIPNQQGRQKSRDTRVKEEYMHYRYMAHLDRKSLDKRATEIFRNTYQIDSNSRLSLDPEDPVTYYWQDRVSEVIQEYAERGIIMEEYGKSIASDKDLFNSLDRKFRNAGPTVGEFSAPQTPYLVKYGELDHIIDLHKVGRIRLGAASEFDDSSLNTARRDQETAREVDWDSAILPHVSRGNIPTFLERPADFRIKANLSVNTNYYVYCVSEALRARIFGDFQANAALIIHQPQEFEHRLQLHLKRSFPGWSFHAGRVEYFDPLNVSPCDVSLPFSKDFSYAYQEEFRFALFPPKPATELTSQFLDIGSLEDISELVLLG